MGVSSTKVYYDQFVVMSTQSPDSRKDYLKEINPGDCFQLYDMSTWFVIGFSNKEKQQYYCLAYYQSLGDESWGDNELKLYQKEDVIKI